MALDHLPCPADEGHVHHGGVSLHVGDHVLQVGLVRGCAIPGYFDGGARRRHAKHFKQPLYPNPIAQLTIVVTYMSRLRSIGATNGLPPKTSEN